MFKVADKEEAFGADSKEWARGQTGHGCAAAAAGKGGRNGGGATCCPPPLPALD